MKRYECIGYIKVADNGGYFSRDEVIKKLANFENNSLAKEGEGVDPDILEALEISQDEIDEAR